MIVYRICKQDFARDLSGKGAEKAGGRWNKRGTAVLYTCPGIALCTTEVAVHLPLGILPDNYALVSIEIPDGEMLKIEEDLLPYEWDTFPYHEYTQRLGSLFVSEARFLCMRVPSAVVPGEYNIIINPAHAQARKVHIKEVKPYRFDKRLFDR